MAGYKGERPIPLEIGELQRSLQTTKFELDYERSARSVEIVAKDEELRKMRIHLQLLEDENDELHEQLGEEEARADEIDANLDDTRALLEEAELAKVQLTNELRMKERELNNMQAELDAMQNISADTTKLLTEKLSLARELATLKPELEHLRSTTASHTNLLSDKLSLQRQLSTIQVELETEKRTAQRLMSKEGKSSESGAELKAEITNLQKTLQREKALREKAEASAEQAQAELETEKTAAKKAKKNRKNSEAKETEALEEEVAALRKELTREKRSKERIEQDAKEATVDHAAEKQRLEKQASKSKRGKKDEEEQSAELDGLREEVNTLKKQVKAAERSAKDAQDELETEKSNVQKAAKTASKASESSGELDGLRKQLSEEQKERKKTEKEHEKARKEWGAKEALLDEKLDAFRSKLRSTKEALKDKEAELQQAQSQPATQTAGPTAAGRGAKNPRKRKAEIDPTDATTIGTPGDMPAKRAKRAYSAAPGDKSTFSITPFLNRTASVAPESPTADKQPDSDPIETATEATPTGPSKIRASSTEPKPLATSTASKANPKTKQGRKQAKPVATLEMVAEEGDGDENTDPADVPVKTTEITQAPKLKPGSMPSKAPRKSLMSFSTFDSEAPEKKKKRKLGGLGLPKTLFDDDDGAPPVKPIPGKGFLANRAIGKSIFGAKGPGPAITGGLRHTTEEGFMFSPLKKERKAMREASMLIGR